VADARNDQPPMPCRGPVAAHSSAM
jgi:hypothetical protein